MQWRKLFDLDPVHAVLSDKIGVRNYVRARVGADHLIPCLWTGEDPAAIPFDTLDLPYVIKSAHGCGQTIFVRHPGTLDEPAARRIAGSWLTYFHGHVTGEPGYVGVPHRLIVERLLLTRDGKPPVEINAYVFDGRAETFVAFIVDPHDRTRQKCHFTRDWRPLPWSFRGEVPMKEPLSRPEQLDEIGAIADRLGAGLDHLRVDLYLCDDRIYVGELAMYSHSGLVPIDPDAADFVLGSYWRLRRPLRRAVATLAAGKRAIGTVPRIAAD